VKRASREAKAQADATKAENAKTAKEEKAKKRKADALETKTAERAKVDAAKAESGSASSSTKPKPKGKPKAEAKAKAKAEPKAEAKAKAKAKGNPVTRFFTKRNPLDDFTNGFTEFLDANAASAGPTVAGPTVAKAGQAAEVEPPAGQPTEPPPPKLDMTPELGKPLPKIPNLSASVWKRMRIHPMRRRQVGCKLLKSQTVIQRKTIQRCCVNALLRPKWRRCSCKLFSTIQIPFRR
jgi:hypothetical protein